MQALLDRFVDDTTHAWNYVTPADFYEDYVKPRRSYVLLDLRRAEDYARGHVRGARHVFWLDLVRDPAAHVRKGQRVFLICYVGHTASQAMALLRLQGYDALCIKYGYGVTPAKGFPVAGWVSLAYPVVT